MLLRPGTEPQFVLDATGIMCGLMTDLDIASESIMLEPGDTLVLYTDGVTEAFNAAEAIFSESRLIGCSWPSPVRPRPAPPSPPW